MFDWIVNTPLICNFILPCREFAAQEFCQESLQNFSCLYLRKVCKILSIFDLVMCNITAQKKITCQK